MALPPDVKKPTSVTEGLVASIDVNTDSIASAGFYPQNATSADTAVGITRDSLGNLVLTDAVSGEISLNALSADTGVTAGDYGNITAGDESVMPYFTVDSKGRLTAADQAPIEIGGKTAKEYVDDQDDATLSSANAYAQSLAFGISSKPPVRAATAAPLGVSYGVDGTKTILTALAYGALPLIDGETLAVTERVLIKDEPGGLAVNNGIYVVTQVGDGSSPWILTRASDADTGPELCGSMVPVQTGFANTGTVWLFAQNPADYTLGVTPVTFTQVTVPQASTSVLGIVQLAGGLGGATTQASSPKLDVGSDNVTSGVLAVDHGGTGVSAPTAGQLLIGKTDNTFALAALTQGDNITITSGSGSVTIAGRTIAFAQEYYVALNGNDMTGDGSLSKPYKSIGAALTAANAVTATEYVRINVAPGLYEEDVTLSRRRTFICGSGTAALNHTTRLKGTTVIDPAAAADKFNDYVGLFGMLLTEESAATAPTLSVTGTGLFTALIDDCYVDSPTTGQYVVKVDASNASRPIVYFRRFYIQRSGATSTATLAQFERGDIRMDSGYVQSNATGTGNGVYLGNNATLTADRVQVIIATTGSGIYTAGTAIPPPAGSGVKMTLSNAYVASTASASPSLYLLCANGYSILTNVILYTAGAGYAIDGVYSSPYPTFLFNDVSFFGTNSTVAPAVDAAKVRLATLGVLPAVNGGTGQSSYAVGDLLYASTTSTLSKLADVAPGNALLSGGTNTAPAWGKVGLTTHVDGTLAATNGGTGQASYTTGDLLYASDATTLSKLADAAIGNALLSGGAGVAPAYGKVGLTTHVSGTLPVGNGGTGLSATPTAGQLLIGSGTGFTLNTLEAGTGVSIENGTGSITISATTGLDYWAENAYTDPPNNVIPAVAWSPDPSLGANVDVVLSPNGSGSLLSRVPDEGVFGGNKRGTSSVDLQLIRSAATQVASGAASTLVGGQNNTASGATSAVLGGNANVASGESSVIGGGSDNEASAQYAVTVGGLQNTASGTQSFCGGGADNEASGLYAVVVGGGTGTASGDASVVLGGIGGFANAYGQLTGGAWAHTFTGVTPGSPVATDPLFVLGNGTTDLTRSNALTLLKNGWFGLGLGQEKPKAALHVAGSARNSGALVQDGFTSGAAINAGDVCYLAADGKVYPARANLAATSTVVGVAVETVATMNQPIALATAHKTGGFTGLTTGTEYFLSSTSAGAVVLYTTLSAASGVQIVSLGYARSSTELQLNIQRRGTTP